MILHIFNPEHDAALANNDKHFVASHAARLLRTDLDFMPALYAKPNDLVLVSDYLSAKKHLKQLEKFAQTYHLVTLDTLQNIKSDITEIRPWAWDKAIKNSLDNVGISKKLMPTDQELSMIRDVSNRQFSASVLKALKRSLNLPNIVGEAVYVNNMKELTLYVKYYKKAILKAPWSCSGRGIRYIDSLQDAYTTNWAHNIIRKQGGVMIEPFYSRVKDFGMEFYAYMSTVDFQGISLFNTTNGAYSGNLIQSEDYKLSVLAKYINPDEIILIKNKLEMLLRQYIAKRYTGPLGVDMMIVADEKHKKAKKPSFFIHPMVEINMRCTMGHVALKLSKTPEAIGKIMLTEYDGSHYHLRLSQHNTELFSL